MRSTGNIACGHRLQSHPGRFPTRSYYAHSTLRLGRALHHLSVTHGRGSRAPLQECGPLPCPVSAFGLGDLLSTHPRASKCCQSNMTPCYDILHRMLQHAAGEQQGFVPVFGHMKVVQLQAQPAGLHKSTTHDYVRRLNNRRQNHDPLIYNVRGKSSEPAPSSATMNFCIFEPRGSRRACTWIGATPVFFPHVSIRRPHPPVRTSPTLLQDAPRRPQQQSLMIHFFSSVGLDSLGLQANHRTIPATTGNAGNLSLNLVKSSRTSHVSADQSHWSHTTSSNTSRSPTNASTVHETSGVGFSMRLSRVFKPKYLLSTERHVDETNTVNSVKSEKVQKKLHWQSTLKTAEQKQHVDQAVRANVPKTGRLGDTLKAKLRPRGSTSHSESSQNWDDTSELQGTDARELTSLSGHCNTLENTKGVSFIQSLPKTP